MGHNGIIAASRLNRINLTPHFIDKRFIYVPEQNDSTWTYRSADITPYIGQYVRVYIVASITNGFAADIQIDDMNFGGNLFNPEDGTLDFQRQVETAQFLSWDEVTWEPLTTSTTNHKWNRDGFGTVSTGTGNVSGYTGDYYFYLEGSGTLLSYEWAWLRSPIIEITGSTLSLYTAQNGVDCGEIEIFMEIVEPDFVVPTIGTLSSVVRDSITTATLTWTAATDNVGVTGYKVYRSSGATDSSFTLLKTVGNVLSTTDTTIVEFDEIHYYYVTALDESGNESSASNHLVVTAITSTNIFNSNNTLSTDTNVLTYGTDANSTSGIKTGRFTTMSIETTDFIDGSYALKLVSLGTDIQQYRETPLSLTSGKTYVIRCWAKASQSGKSSIRTSVTWTTSDVSVTTSWTEVTLTVTAASTATGYLRYYTAYGTVDGTEELLVDGVRVYELN